MVDRFCDQVLSSSCDALGNNRGELASGKTDLMLHGWETLLQVPCLFSLLKGRFPLVRVSTKKQNPVLSRTTRSFFLSFFLFFLVC